jgi:hypothetical protein
VDSLNGDFRGYEHIKELAAALGKQNGIRGRPVPVRTLLAMSENRDPFYAGKPAQRVKAEWFAALWRRFGYTAGVHLRRVHYRLVSQERGQEPPRRHDGEEYENTEHCWEDLQEAGAMARYLRLVPADAFEDRRNPEPHIYMQPELLVREQRVWLEALEEWTLPAIEHALASLIDLSLPGVDEVTGYDYHATDQPYHVELWIEKSTMDDVLVPICEELHVNLVSSLGFQSITGVIKLLQRVCELARICKAGKPARVFYISDFDPAGDSMPVAVARQVEFWVRDYAPGTNIKLTPLVLTEAQADAYDLPRIPIKEADNRKERFEERYDEGAVELDALEALYPGELARIVREAIEPYRDRTLARRLDEAEEEAREEAEEAWEKRVAPYREELDAIRREGRDVAARYDGQLEELNETLQAELAPLRQRMEAVRQAVQEARDQFEVEMPERPEPEIDPVDEDDWLFSSDRTYFAQLAMYKARRNGQVEDAAD